MCIYISCFNIKKFLHFSHEVCLCLCVSMTLTRKPISCYAISVNRTSTKLRLRTRLPAIAFTSFQVFTTQLPSLSFSSTPFSVFLFFVVLVGSNSKLTFACQTDPFSVHEKSISALPQISLVHASTVLHLR